jgi:mannose-1-phosphate guanylyltransferase
VPTISVFRYNCLQGGVVVNIILCGGSGTRLWPLSRSLYPKQFVKIFNNKSLFQLTVERNSQLCEKTLVVTNEKLLFMASDQAAEVAENTVEKYSYLLESVGRNTAPAIALACMKLDPEELVLVSSSDHMIADVDAYSERITEAAKIAETGMLLTFGIQPSYPETGYGYIEADNNSKIGNNSYTVQAFKEKPDEATAQKYIESGNYYWNSGMFVFKAGVFLEELTKYSPEIFEMSQIAIHNCVERDTTGQKQFYIHLDDMEKIPSNSIDYAVMEQSNKVAVVASDFGWNDLGSFDALYSELEKDTTGNAKIGDVISIDSNNNILISGDRKIAAIDIKDSIIIDTMDALLISKRGSSQKVKQVVNSLKKGDDKDADLTAVHTTAHRPWGTYTVLEDHTNFKIKRIVVKPGHRLSLQRHSHRSEHWVVVSGTATVQKGDTEIVISRNESTYISIGEMHRLTNNGKIPVVLIETQVGEYVGEDDIERFEDDYQRVI